MYSLKISTDMESIYCLSSDLGLVKRNIKKPDKIDYFKGFHCGLSDESFDVSESLGIICGISSETPQNIIIFDLSVNLKTKNLSGHTEDVNSVVISESTKKLISAANDRRIIIRGLNNFEIEHDLNTLHMSDVKSLFLKPSGEEIFSASHDKRFYEFSLLNPNKILSHGKIKQKINKVVFNKKTHQVFCVSDKKHRIYVWSLSHQDNFQKNEKYSLTFNSSITTFSRNSILKSDPMQSVLVPKTIYEEPSIEKEIKKDTSFLLKTRNKQRGKNDLVNTPKNANKRSNRMLNQSESRETKSRLDYLNYEFSSQSNFL